MYAEMIVYCNTWAINPERDVLQGWHEAYQANGNRANSAIRREQTVYIAAWRLLWVMPVEDWDA
jgi:hypothetical protein